MNNREIKRRIASVKETVKITRAMYSISVAKMLKGRAALPAAERFYEEATALLARIATRDSAFFLERGRRAAFIVIGGDKGLCGDYNDRVVQEAIRALSEREERYLFTVGTVTRDKLAKAGFEPDMEFLHSADNPSPEAAYSIAADLVALFKEDLLDEIRMVYSSVTDNRSEPVTELLVPFVGEAEDPLREAPTTGAVRHAVYAYLAAAVYRGLLSSSLAEHLARVRAMPQATENGENMIADLTAKYNKVRQEGITRALQDVSTPTDR